MLSTGFVAAEHANIPIGGSVAVLSQGPVGLMATAGARLRGAGLVIGVEAVPNRIALARKYVCDVWVDFTKENPVAAILKLTGGTGGGLGHRGPGLGPNLRRVRERDLAGWDRFERRLPRDGDSVPIPREDWGVGMGDKTIGTGLCPGGSEWMGRLMRLIEAARVDPLALTSHRFAFKNIEMAFRMMQTKKNGMVKPLISFA